MDVKSALTDKVSGLTPTQREMMRGVYGFEFTGPGGASLTLVIDEQGIEVRSGPDDAAAVTISMPAADFLAILDGRLDPMQAFMAGTLRVDGAVDQAMRLQDLFG
jgi:putative sterol carrier protein